MTFPMILPAMILPLLVAALPRCVKCSRSFTLPAPERGWFLSDPAKTSTAMLLAVTQNLPIDLIAAMGVRWT